VFGRLHLRWDDGGLVVTIRTSKWNPHVRRVRAAALGGPACPVITIRAWLDAAGLIEGAVFRRVSSRGAIGSCRLQDGAVARLVKAVAARVGIEPRSVAAHSLRAGYATVSIRDGVSPARVQQSLGHATAAMTFRYVHEAEVEGGDRPFHLGSTR
jgi:integrase